MHSDVQIETRWNEGYAEERLRRGWRNPVFVKAKGPVDFVVAWVMASGLPVTELKKWIFHWNYHTNPPNVYLLMLREMSLDPCDEDTCRS